LSVIVENVSYIAVFVVMQFKATLCIFEI